MRCNNIDPAKIQLDITDEKILEAAVHLGSGGCCTKIDRIGPAKLQDVLKWVLVPDEMEIFYVPSGDNGWLRVTALVGVTTNNDNVAFTLLVPVQAEVISDQPVLGHDELLYNTTMCYGMDGFNEGSVYWNPLKVVLSIKEYKPNTPFKGYFTADENKANQYKVLDERVGQAELDIIKAFPDYWSGVKKLVSESPGDQANSVHDRYIPVALLGIDCWQ